MNRSSPEPASDLLRLSEVLSALSFALDLSEGLPMGHSLRSALVAAWIAKRLDLTLGERRDLYFAAFVKDAGCTAGATQVYRMFERDERALRAALLRVDVRDLARAAVGALAHATPGAPWPVRARRIAEAAHRGGPEALGLVEARCHRGAEIAAGMGLGSRVAEAVRALDEHWDGGGGPRGLRRDEIPIVSRILLLARTVEVIAARDGAAAALEAARRRAGRWFDPRLVSACEGLEPQLVTWGAMDRQTLRERVTALEPGDAALLTGRAGLDRIATQIARVVDAKSPFTGAHSQRVADTAVRVAGELGWTGAGLAHVRQAALLHDLGKLSVPNTILDKAGPLNGDEWSVMRRHAHYTEEFLAHVAGFEQLAFESASHHERLDGRGYGRGLSGNDVPALARVLAVADVYDALRSSRPYRGPLPPEQVFEIMGRERGTGFDADCHDALVRVVEAPGGDARPAA